MMDMQTTPYKEAVNYEQQTNKQNGTFLIILLRLWSSPEGAQLNVSGGGFLL
jgi:hypothetical protein